MIEIINRILDKVLSGRFIATVLVIGTYCAAIHEVNVLVGQKLISVETYIAVLGGFGALATFIVKSYFDSNHGDPTNNNNGGKEDVKSDKPVPTQSV